MMYVVKEIKCSSCFLLILILTDVLERERERDIGKGNDRRLRKIDGRWQKQEAASNGRIKNVVVWSVAIASCGMKRENRE